MQTSTVKPNNVIFSSTATMSANQSPAWGGAAPCWGSPTPQTCALADVMSEELAQQLETEEHGEHMNDLNNSQQDFIDVDSMVQTVDCETSDDLLLAQMLQHEFDREHDKLLDREEQKCNGTSKVKISFENYRSLHPKTYEEEEEEEQGEEVWEEEEKDDPVPSFNKSGIAGKGKNIVTKHDSHIAGRRNANKMEQFPPEFDTGDSRKMKVRLPNNVYNNLKKHSERENKRSQRLHEKKEYSTTEMAVDAKTRLILYKLVNGGMLESVEGVVSSGKESVVFHGTGGNMNDALVPLECAIKVFKTTLSTFKNRYEYVRGDRRFTKDELKKQNPRKIIKIWAEKELANLKRMESYGIPCPKAVVLKKHVLVMEFIGKDQVPAPKLQDARLSTEDLQLAYEQCIDNMRRMYRECGLVHADLSSYNMLWYEDTLYFIDLAQGVDIMHQKAMDFLLRDCQNVVKFFKMGGVHGVMNEYELFNDITGLGLHGKGQDFLAQIEQYEKKEDKLRLGEVGDYAFNYFFEKAQKEREERKKRLGELFDESDSDSDDGEVEGSLDPAVEGRLQLELRLDVTDMAEDLGGEELRKSSSDVEEFMSHDQSVEGSHDLSFEGSHDLSLEGSHDLGVEGSHDLGVERSHDPDVKGSHEVTE